MRPRWILPLAGLALLAGGLLLRSPARIAPEPSVSEPGAMARPEAAAEAQEGRWDQIDESELSAATRELYERFKEQSGQRIELEEPDASGGALLTLGSREMLGRLKPLAVSLIEARMIEAQALAGGGVLPGDDLEPFFRLPFTYHDSEECNHSKRELFDPVIGVSTQRALEGEVFAVAVSFGVPGGTDDVIAIFHRDGGPYRLSMVISSGEIKAAREALSMAKIFISPGMAGYMVLVAHHEIAQGAPFHPAHLRLFSPCGEPARPTLYASESVEVAGSEKFSSVFSKIAGFVLVEGHFSGRARLLPEEDRAGSLRQYHLAYLENLAPLEHFSHSVHRPEDLPDEWLRLPWKEEDGVHDPGEPQGCLRERHRQLTAGGGLSGRLSVKRSGKEVRLSLASPRVTFVVSDENEMLDVIVGGKGCRR